ncbi:MAG: SusD/RagB family nutrient-binding outer membrane lipoprotein [Bacteroidales bacterium]
MKKILTYFLMFAVVAIFSTSCDKWLDVDINPDSVADGPDINEQTYLIGVEAEWAELSVAQFRWWNQMINWVLWYASDGTQGYEERFEVGIDQGSEVWNSYSGSLKHAVALYDKAKSNGNKRFQGIGAVIAAWHWFYLADVYDQAPLDEAMTGKEYIHPTPQPLTDLYAHANSLLDEAITLFEAADPGDLVPRASEDYMGGADWDKWVKLAYSLKARQAMRLTYLPGTTPTAQADLVLQYLAHGMTDNADQMEWIHQSDINNRSWAFRDYEYDYSAAGFTPSIWIVDLMNSLNDPRRYVFFTDAEAGGFVGHVSGNASVSGNRPSRYKDTFITPEYGDKIMQYAECLFLKAEAYALKSDFPNAQIALDAGVTADMLYHGIDQADIDAYLAQPELTVPADVEDAQKLIITEKYLANVFETLESYYDFIRTGYPEFDFPYSILNIINDNTYPRRYSYPSDEIEKNPNVIAIGQPDYFLKGVSWDTKPFAWR